MLREQPSPHPSPHRPLADRSGRHLDLHPFKVNSDTLPTKTAPMPVDQTGDSNVLLGNWRRGGGGGGREGGGHGSAKGEGKSAAGNLTSQCCALMTSSLLHNFRSLSYFPCFFSLLSGRCRFRDTSELFDIEMSPLSII